MINTYITELVNYGITNGLIDELDRVYTTNKLIELFGLDEYNVYHPLSPHLHADVVGRNS